jgi:signal peptidase I
MVRDGDLVITLRLQKPFINAAVMYRHDGRTTVGRVIAMEGSVVDISKNGTFTVNGNAPSEEVFYPTYPADGSDIKYPYTVPEGKVFILNDFREDTNDSRSFGAVDTGDLQGTLLLTMRRRGF